MMKQILSLPVFPALLTGFAAAFTETAPAAFPGDMDR